MAISFGLFRRLEKYPFPRCDDRLSWSATWNSHNPKMLLMRNEKLEQGHANVSMTSTSIYRYNGTNKQISLFCFLRTKCSDARIMQSNRSTLFFCFQFVWGHEQYSYLANVTDLWKAFLVYVPPLSGSRSSGALNGHSHLSQTLLLDMAGNSSWMGRPVMSYRVYLSLPTGLSFYLSLTLRT